MTVSQGSAAMSLRCGGICNNHSVANFVQSTAVKNFENRLIFREVIDTSIGCLVFLTHTVHLLPLASVVTSSERVQLTLIGSFPMSPR